ncbi:MAG TPA: T9SS type A sorting domain-containing protein, partial [Ignavibacteriaceae bacterium]|nr:T9SS type A sorting domain-containing protein [Ignavibacteriaceae bacterium]
YRVEFQGGDITLPANYISSVIDSFLVPEPDGAGGQLDVFAIGNMDGDAPDEVIYTQGYTRGIANDTTADAAILDIVHTPVSVELETDVVPAQFYLDQNYPNPFNPSTQIKFGITEAANVDLRIYDVLGSEVAVLINNQYLGAGSYNAKFNAVNLASGIYVYRLTAGTNSVSRKMQLLK